eukprot:TRINITY_DN11403_c0_g1_i1.p1 TRINITY_DN11403_c0_g1~~TRINITY_DN11403_c0_g1_i1.p1  ORF type:complete len:103 (+),score=2.75 TRINITY_DN11403_c0_g1_i1:31-339(+)
MKENEEFSLFNALSGEIRAMVLNFLAWRDLFSVALTCKRNHLLVKKLSKTRILRVKPNGPGPAERVGHVSCLVDDKMYIHGGHGLFQPCSLCKRNQAFRSKT